jgi:hypothetical protein
MSDWIFAFVHLFLLIAIIVYALVSLAQGNTFRFGLIAVCLIIYYLVVLHKPVKREIERRRKNKN